LRGEKLYERHGDGDQDRNGDEESENAGVDTEATDAGFESLLKTVCSPSFCTGAQRTASSYDASFKCSKSSKEGA
jgi:hypothetical protein